MQCRSLHDEPATAVSQSINNWLSFPGMQILYCGVKAWLDSNRRTSISWIRLESQILLRLPVTSSLRVMSRAPVKYVPQVSGVAVVILIHGTPEIGAVNRDASLPPPSNTGSILGKRIIHHSSSEPLEVLHTSYVVWISKLSHVVKFRLSYLTSKGSRLFVRLC